MASQINLLPFPPSFSPTGPFFLNHLCSFWEFWNLMLSYRCLRKKACRPKMPNLEECTSPAKKKPVCAKLDSPNRKDKSCNILCPSSIYNMVYLWFVYNTAYMHIITDWYLNIFMSGPQICTAYMHMCIWITRRAQGQDIARFVLGVGTVQFCTDKLLFRR